MFDFKVDPEFKNLIRPLKKEELDGLEKDIIEKGCLDPLKIWNGLLIDGHHRFDICQNNNIEFKTVELNTWTDRDDVKIWILNSQLQRRNLSDFERIEIVLQKKEILKNQGRMEQKEAGKLYGEKHPKQEVLSESDKTSCVVDKSDLFKDNIDSKEIDQDFSDFEKNEIVQQIKSQIESKLPQPQKKKQQKKERHNTQKQLASEAGVSTGKLAKAEIIIKKADEEIKENLRAGDMTVDKAYREIKKEEKQKEAEVKRQEYLAIKEETSEDDIVRCGDAIEVMKTLDNNSVDLIFTDPPYDKDHIKFYGLMAEQAKRVLKVGGSLITYVGHYAIPEVCKDMGEHLKFWWIIAMQHSGKISHLQGKWVYVEWKPLLWYVNESRGKNNNFVADFIKSEEPDKLLHKWQQGMKEAEYYIQHLTYPGDLVLDPFCGSGTTILTALQNDRRAIGIDEDSQNVKIVKGRISEYSSKTKKENNT